VSKSNRQPVAVLGAGGHAKVVIATLQAAGFTVAALFDDDAAKQGTALLGVEVRGTMADFVRSNHRRAVVAIGNNRTRLQAVERLTIALPNVEWITAVHPHASVQNSVKLGAGTVVFAGAVIQPDTVIGTHVIINTGATVDHDGVIGDFVHLAPGTHLSGEVRVGRGAFVGIGAAIIPGRCVGEWATVGAGAVVIKDIPAGATAVGVPARVISERDE
jgi:sugar O-acyltransferase (sialic acid O-acetyltransferase NeuD family)